VYERADALTRPIRTEGRPTSLRDAVDEATKRKSLASTPRMDPASKQRMDPASAERSEPAPGRKVRDSEPLTPLDLHFSDADEIYVENAGLVILWPFLENFFAHLDLLKAKAFKDENARQRAIGVLQYMATEEAAAPEFLVPLNKVLCGMQLDEVFDFGPPITGAEIDACTGVLTAAIHHAPILRDMSIDGFRGSFLLRRGQLSVRDGNWLLRVERETYDIVLDRFPWSTRIVRLPWMAALMTVEW
jgi:contractile injection system tape measure protein